MPAPPPESPKQPKHEHAAARQPELHPSASGFPGLPPAGRRSGWQIPPPTQPSASAHHPSCWAEAAATYGGAGASTPNLCRSATAASIAYASPLTGEQQQPAQPRRETRTSSASAQLRGDLVAAARASKLPYCDGPLLDVFAETAGSRERTPEELEELDGP